MKRFLSCFLIALILLGSAAASGEGWVLLTTPAPETEAQPTPTPEAEAQPMSTPAPETEAQLTPTPEPETQAQPTPTIEPESETQSEPSAGPETAAFPELSPAPAASESWYDPAWYDEASGRLDLSGLKLDDAATGLKWLEKQLPFVPGLKWVDLSFSSLPNDTLARLREDMAEKGVKIVWTLTLGRSEYFVRTDDQVFSTRHSSGDRRLEDEDVACLRYATELRALDLGHNWLFDASFLEPMKELRVVILSDNKISDLSCLAGKPLEYLEIFNTHVEDLSFLKNCDTLLDLNICTTWVSDLSPLYHLPNLQRLWVGNGTRVKWAERQAFLSWQGDRMEAYDFQTDMPTMYGWRGDEDGPGHPRYEIIKAMFKENTYYDFDTVLRPDQYVVLRRKKSPKPSDDDYSYYP